MAQGSGWFIHTISTKNDRTVGNNTPDATIDTGATGVGPSLQAGETFKVGATTFTYGRHAKVGQVNGFWATSGEAKYFFSKAAADNRPVTYTAGETVICFYPGTLIRTPAGEVAVERLAIGDLVLTVEGTARPVRWIGRQTVSTRFADPLRVLPIRIAAGALAEGLPARDLLVSPDHAILVEGVLVQAGALVNGTTVRRDADVPETFTYHHVELADHSLILAEGVPAKTFVDHVERLAFDNWEEHEALYGAAAPIVEMPLPRAKAQRRVPLALRRRLELRAVLLTGLAAAA
jgi:hypothetical protein